MGILAKFLLCSGAGLTIGQRIGQGPPINEATLLEIISMSRWTHGPPPLPAAMVRRGIGRLLCRARPLGQQLAIVYFEDDQC
jgi:hypothetical protein